MVLWEPVLVSRACKAQVPGWCEDVEMQRWMWLLCHCLPPGPQRVGPAVPSKAWGDWGCWLERGKQVKSRSVTREVKHLPCSGLRSLHYSGGTEHSMHSKYKESSAKADEAGVWACWLKGHDHGTYSNLANIGPGISGWERVDWLECTQVRFLDSRSRRKIHVHLLTYYCFVLTCVLDLSMCG